METNHLSPEAAAVVLIGSGIVWAILFIGLAVGNGFIAARLGKSVPLWVILSLIPGYNLIFMYYVGYYVVCRMLNRLDQIASNAGTLARS